MSHRRYDICPETSPAVLVRPVPKFQVNRLEPPGPIPEVVLGPNFFQRCSRPRLHRPCREREDQMAPG